MVSKPAHLSPGIWKDFWSYVFVDRDECWMWTGPENTSHYGLFLFGSRWMTAHRLSYTWCKRTIPAGFHIHHICGNKLCINPNHLIALPPRAHARMHGATTFGVRTKKKTAEPRTHCKNGHEINDENSFRDGQGFFRCRACEAEKKKRYRARHAEYCRTKDREYKRRVRQQSKVLDNSVGM